MGLDAEDLLLRPLGEVVMLANAALANSEAEADDRMTTAASSLLREAERSKRKVEAVWESEVGKHGAAFRTMMVQQGSVEAKRFHLESLLWDFEDVVHLDNFQSERYKTLQAAVRALALDIVETAKRLNPLVTSAPPTPTGGFPPLPPLPVRPSKPQNRSLRSGHAGTMPQHESCKVDPRPPDKDAGADLDSFLDALWEGRSGTAGGNRPAGCPTPRISSDSIIEPRIPEIDRISSSPSLEDETLNLITPTITAEPGLLTHIANPSEATLSDPATADVHLKSGADECQILFSDLLGEELEPKPRRIDGQRDTKLYHLRTANLTIRDDSTYHRLKGLCSGAVKFRRDGHWGSIVKTTEYGQGGDMLRASDGIMPFQYDELSKVARCGDCSYSHGLDEVTDDMDGKAEAIRTSVHGGARYRLRFLFKSHLRSGSLPGPSYACIWCVQAGSTVREGDATVFLSADDLLRHVAGHPQPLPQVRGATVLYDKAEDSVFDLHLPESPVPVPMPYNVANLATAVATRDEYRRPGRTKLERPPGYAGEMLEFLEGATLVGVMFPAKWEAKWGLGRHDGVFGAFPAKAVDIRPPEESEIPVGSTSGMSVTARWKWPPGSSSGSRSTGTGKKSKTPWLSFAKGEVIHNVQYLHAEYWVWSGSNSKGKTGVFPRSHVVMDTLRPSSSEQNKMSKKRGLFSRAGSSSSR